MRIIRRYLPAALVLIACALLFSAGASWRERTSPESGVHGAVLAAPRTLFHEVPTARRAETDQLNALGYLSGYEEAPAVEGVTVYDEGRSYEGLNLYTSGHAPEAYLMDMDGVILHRWSYPLTRLWTNEKFAPEYFRYARVSSDGDLLAIFEPLGIFKLDKDSNLLWANENGAHHDLAVQSDESIYVLTQKLRPLSWFSDYGAIVDEFISQLTPGGELIREVSLMECLRDSRYSAYLMRAKRAGDILHSNALKLFDGRHSDRWPAAQAGNLLVSLRELNAIVVVDMDAQEVVWALSGMWFRQHAPTFLKNGNLLLFDNRGNGGKSKVIELDPVTQEIVWTYGETEHEPLHSSTCGTAMRLPNGNTLITESNRGRAIEVTPENEIVWEYISPHRAGERNELIATLLTMQRLPASFEPEWLDTESAARMATSQ